MNPASECAVSVVIPAHDEAACLPELLARVVRVLDLRGRGSEVVIVDDGSTDATWQVIQQAAASDARIRGLRLSRNFGHQAALSAGLGSAAGELVITMDGDLQHPPHLIPTLIAKHAEGFDVVYGVRANVDSEGWLKIHAARVFYQLLNRLTGLDLPIGAGDFRLMTRRVVDQLLAMPERQRFLRGMTRWVGYPQAVVEYSRGPRAAGETKYRLRAMVRFALDAITSFSAVPLWLASIVGMAVSALGGVYLIYVILVGLLSSQSVPGWSSVLASALIIGGVQLACIGIMGQYVGRMYEELKSRPLFVIWESTSNRENSDDASAVAGIVWPD